MWTVVNRSMVTVGVKVGRIAAHCPLCRAAEFLALDESRRATDLLTCKTCRAKFTHEFLVQQITHATMEESERAIELSKKMRRATD